VTRHDYSSKLPLLSVINIHYSFIHLIAQQVTHVIKNTLKHTARWAGQQDGALIVCPWWKRNTSNYTCSMYI